VHLRQIDLKSDLSLKSDFTYHYIYVSFVNVSESRINHYQQTHDASALVKALHDTLSVAQNLFTHAIFCTNTTFKETGFCPDLVSVNVSALNVQGLSVEKALAKNGQKQIGALTLRSSEPSRKLSQLYEQWQV
jgi:hypothetical protein